MHQVHCCCAQEKEARDETGVVLADQTRLQRLHAQLQQDYDRLRQEREDLKTSERGLRLEIAKLRYGTRYLQVCCSRYR